MPRSQVPTVEQRPAYTVLVIGGPAALVDATELALDTVAPAAVVECDVVSAATAAAEHRPVAMVMGESLHIFDADEFAALARDVGSTLLVVRTDDRDIIGMSRELTGPLFSAFQKHNG